MSTTPLPMEIIRQPPITNLARHWGTDHGIANVAPVVPPVAPFPMEIIRQPPITNLARNWGLDPAIAYARSAWGVSTIVLRVEQENENVDIFTWNDDTSTCTLSSGL